MNKKQEQILSYLKRQKVKVKRIRDLVFQVDLRGVKMTEKTFQKLVLEKLTSLETDVSELKKDMAEVKKDVSELKTDVSELKKDMAEVKKDIELIKSLPTISKEIRELNRSEQ